MLRVVFSLLILITGCLITGKAQAPLIQRSDLDELLRVDPRGQLPFWVNDPLPFIAHPARACVQEKSLQAEYFRWNDNAGWVPEKGVVREYAADGKAIVEFIRFHDGQAKKMESGFSYDKDGLLLSRSDKITDESGMVSYVNRICSYDAGLLIKDDTYSTTGDVVTLTGITTNRLSFDRAGMVTNISSHRKSGEDVYNTTIYDLSYVEGKLSNIQQSTLLESNGRYFPTYRYDAFDSEDKCWNFNGFDTHIFQESSWVLINKVSKIRNDKQGMVWEGLQYADGSESSRTVSKIMFDDAGNMTDFMQFNATGEQMDPELIGHVHLDITYSTDNVTPVQVVSSYLKPDKTYSNSLKVVYETASEKDNLITLFPNPADDRCTVYIHRESDTSYDVSITDMEGRMVFSKHIRVSNSRYFDVDTADLPPGAYQLQVVEGAFKANRKFLVVR